MVVTRRLLQQCLSQNCNKLPEHFQQWDVDYTKVQDQEICFKKHGCRELTTGNRNFKSAVIRFKIFLVLAFVLR